jgi:hypothetical protein
MKKSNLSAVLGFLHGVTDIFFSSEMLLSVQLWSVTDVPEQPIGINYRSFLQG